MQKELLSRRLLTLVAPLIFLSAALPGRFAQTAEQAAPAPKSAIVSTENPSVPTTQVADEITRRLRRMGINIIKTRLDNPYDGAGELC